jgi:hypothetical protein
MWDTAQPDSATFVITLDIGALLLMPARLAFSAGCAHRARLLQNHN